MMSERVACRHSSCNSSFSSQQAMEQHYKDSHESPQYKKFPCAQCSRSFHSAAALTDHLVSAHRLDSLVAATTASTSHIVDAPSVLPLDLQLNGVACNDCGKCFDTTDHLHRHQWDSPPTHTRVCDTRKPNFASPVRGCSQCGRKLASSEDLEQHFVEQHPITEILVSDEDGILQSIAQHFRQAWKAPTVKLYKVERIFKVYNPGWRRKDFEQYRKEIKQAVMAILSHKQEELDDSLRTKMLHNGNELRRYHGTTVKCALGRQSKAVDISPAASIGHSLCTQTDCGMCRILQTGFKQSKCKVERFQRFGKGIYCSSVSSKASAYVRCSNINSGAGSSIISCNYFTSILSSFNPFRYFYGLLKYVFGIFSIGISTSATAASGNYKVIMACKVLAGRPYRSTRNLQNLEGPPPGYQSVQGEPGLHLNYEELVLYDDRAILPDFIILYSSSDSS